jgi:glycosyltransferase involved in cell wall biosynthesis
MRDEEIDATVVVPARDAVETIARTLSALSRQDFDGEYEVLIVDNGSVDDTAEVASNSPACDRVLRRARGEGPGAARNEAAAVARGRVLAFTDADCEPAPQWLAAGVRALVDADVVQGAVRPAPDVFMGPFDRSLSVGCDVGLYQTASFFVKREVFAQLGGFEDWIGVGDSIRRPFGEDVWLGWRARRAGARVAFCPDALVHHAVLTGHARTSIEERRREEYFPFLAARVPELRDSFFYRRYFLSHRSAVFDLALAGTVLAIARRQPLALAAAVPYARQLLSEARAWGWRRVPLVASARVAADAVGAVSLARGSLRARAAVL